VAQRHVIDALALRKPGGEVAGAAASEYNLYSTTQETNAKVIGPTSSTKTRVYAGWRKADLKHTFLLITAPLLLHVDRAAGLQ